MSGIISASLWEVSAVLARFDVPVPVHIGFIVAAALSMFFGSYWAWNQAVTEGDKAVAEANRKSAERESELAEKLESAEKRIRDLENRLNSDPRRCAIRTEISGFIARLEQLKQDALAGKINLASEVYPLDHAVRRYLQEYCPEYRGYEGGFPISDSYSNGLRIDGCDVVRRCDDRLAKLRTIQS